MDLRVFSDGNGWRARAAGAAQSWPCAIGRGGVTQDKREGDGATPLGRWPLREVLYRPDRLAAPETALGVQPLSPDMGWCDDPEHPDYNRLIRRPSSARHETLWRHDRVYDVIVVLGYNDSPVVPGLGSAIFLHVARPRFEPTEGCVALRQADLLGYLGYAGPGDAVIVEPA